MTKPVTTLVTFGALTATVVLTAAVDPGVKNLSITGPIGAAAWRDTLPYTLRWGRAANATSYRVTVTAAATPAGVTTGLPNALIVPDTFVTFSAVNLTYDSMNFTASVTAVRGTQSSTTPATKSWSIARKPGNPGPIIVDSTLIPPVVMTQVRPVYAIMNGVQTLQYTSYDTQLVYARGTYRQVTSWSCPVYPPGSPYGKSSPPACYPGFTVPETTATALRLKSKTEIIADFLSSIGL